MSHAPGQNALNVRSSQRKRRAGTNHPPFSRAPHSPNGLTPAIDGTLDPFSSPSWDIQRVLPTRRSRRAQSADGMLALPGTESDYLPASIRSASSVA